MAQMVIEYRRRMPDVTFQLVPSRNSVVTIEALRRGEAEMGIALSDSAYLANQSVGPTRSQAPGFLRGLAILDGWAMHVLVRRETSIRNISDLRGRVVGVPDFSTAPNADATLLTTLILRAAGFDPDSVRLVPLSVEQVNDRFRSGTLDAMFYNALLAGPLMRQLDTRNFRLVSLSVPVISRLEREYPFVRRLGIPPNTYSKQRDGITTVGVDSILICRSDLDDSLVYDLTRHFFAILARGALRDQLHRMNVAQALATPLPLHPGAARYYRELELFK